MKKLKIRIVNMMVLVTMLMSAMPVMPANAISSIQIGEYLEMGTYYGEPILWRCVDIDEQGPLMLSDRILCTKEYDTGNEQYYSTYRKEYGSNYWNSSCLKQWLNSSDNRIVWSYSAPSYNAESGFLTNFTGNELKMIKEVRQRTYLNNADSQMADGGNSKFEYTATSDLKTFFSSNPNNKWYQYTTEKMFVLGFEQAKAVYDNFGSDYMFAYPTTEAVLNSGGALSEKDYVDYWLRVPLNNGMSYENNAYIHKNIGVAPKQANSDNIGVRPAFYMDFSRAQIVSGNGNVRSPYIMDLNNIRNDEKTTLNGHTYKVFDKGISWTEAEEYCEELGGHLATITSEEEQIYITKLIEKGTKNGYWIGGIEEEYRSGYKWITDEKMEYTNWGSAQPDRDNKNGMNVMMIYRATNGAGNEFGKWNDIENEGRVGNISSYTSDNMGFICEWDSLVTSYYSEVSQWSSPEMEEAYGKDLIPENLVSKNLTQRVTRGEFAAIAVKLYEALSDKRVVAVKTPFIDIANNVNSEDISKAYGLNVAVGVSDTEFEPNSDINREQLATMLCRVIKKYKFNDWSYASDSEYYLASEGVKLFADDAQISAYAKPSVYYMVKMGIIDGIDDSHFAPRNTTVEEEAQNYATATREQAIALSLRTYKLSDMWK